MEVKMEIVNREEYDKEGFIGEKILSIIKDDNALYIVLSNGYIIKIKGDYYDTPVYHSTGLKNVILERLEKLQINQIHSRTLYTETYVKIYINNKYEIIFNSTRDVGSPNVKIEFLKE